MAKYFDIYECLVLWLISVEVGRLVMYAMMSHAIWDAYRISSPLFTESVLARSELFMYFYIKNYIGTHGEDL